MSASGYFTRLVDLLRPRGDRPHVGLYLTPTTVWMVAVVVDRQGLQVLAQHHERMDPERWQDALPSLLNRFAPSGADLHIVLAPAFYSLVLVDAPQVPEEELKEAARWRIRELVQQPVDTLVIDVFSLPSDAFRGRLNMIYVAATAQQLVRRLAQLHSDRFPLAGIGVQELALMHVCKRLPEHQMGGVALLSMEEGAGGIHLSEAGRLYLSRGVDFSARDGIAEMPSVEGRADRLALDIQRSLDYYESQIGKIAPSRLLWFSSESLNDTLIQTLQSRVTVECVPVDLDSLTAWPEPALPEHQLCWATALGAALMGEELHANATH